MKTIAQQIKWDFKTNGDLIIRNKNSNIIYWETSNSASTKCERDSKGNQIYYENSKGEIRDNRPKPLKPNKIDITTTKTYKVGQNVYCMTEDSWMLGEIKGIDLRTRTILVHIEDYNEIREFKETEIK